MGINHVFGQTYLFWLREPLIDWWTLMRHVHYFLNHYKGFAADRGSLEMDSRVLGDLVLPLIVWYMFSIFYFFIYLIYQGRWPWYILVKMIPKKRSSWVSVPWMFQYTVNSYPPFGNHAKMGIDNLCLHPFTLLFVEVPVRTNDHHSIVVQIVFFGGVGYFDKIWTYYIYICISINAADRGSLEMDSRVLGDLVLPLIVWYIYFPMFISLSILSIKVGGLGIY